MNTSDGSLPCPPAPPPLTPVTKLERRERSENVVASLLKRMVRHAWGVAAKKIGEGESVFILSLTEVLSGYRICGYTR
jgi:hypothetical protein